MPSVLNDFGLKAALENMCGQFNSVNDEAKIVFHSGGEFFRLSNEVEVSLYRIAQEATNNALKYAGADTITIRLEEKETHQELSIEDNGKGFDYANGSLVNRTQGNGLHNMGQRCELIGAKLKIQSQKMEGTKVTVHFQAN